MNTHDEDVIDLVDNCIASEGAHYDVARVVHALCKDAFRYNETTDAWMTLSLETQQWASSRKGFPLRHRLSTDVVRAFMERALYWANQALTYPIDRERFKEKSDRLAKITLKLKNNTYKNGIMEECKGFFAPAAEAS